MPVSSEAYASPGAASFRRGFSFLARMRPRLPEKAENMAPTREPATRRNARSSTLPRRHPLLLWSVALNPRIRASLVFHGAVVVMLGLLTGFPHALVLTGQLVGEERAWRMAHLEGLLNGMLMMLAGAAGGSLALSVNQERWLLWALAAAAYGNVIASVFGASFGVRGLALTAPSANALVNLLFWVAIGGAFVGVALLITGAAAAIRAERS